MVGRDGESDIMAYGYTAWVAGVVLAAIISGLLFGLAQPIS
ncbi:dihydroxy-acid dehydratase [Stappia sp. GBMRC 2046]|uniref:Dihydroxy-acid dehydratase n=1 Tax=Stappia sediminis TaxID=2692190 RepID=A0A7X3LSC6_9HYPH|nr:dihydroxy-acid dehydratase [Stappia sediminis]MXN64209.1 dihydroxy-acid dehydratase [Stappia sediminis]